MANWIVSPDKKPNWSKVKGGDTVVLQQGFHGDLVIYGCGSRGVGVVSVKPEKGSHVVLSRLIVDESFGVEIDFNYQVEFNSDEKGLLVDVRGGEACIVEHFNFSDSLDVGSWADVRDGVFIRGIKNVVRHFDLDNVRHGVQVSGDSCLAHHFNIDGFSGDSLRWLGNRACISDASAKGFVFVDDELHGDLAQAFVDGVLSKDQHKHSLSGLVAKNLVLEDSSGRCQGFMSDTVIKDSVFENVLIDVDHLHGFTLAESQNNTFKKVNIKNNKSWFKFGSNNKGYGQSVGNTLIGCSANQFIGVDGMRNNNKPVIVYDARIELADEFEDGKVPRGIRNNNPTNIDFSKDIPWHGQVDHADRLDSQKTELRFCVFVSPEMGIRAAILNLKTSQKKWKNRTIKQLVARWAPSSENNTAAYVRDICNWTGFSANQVINVRDFNTAVELIKAFIRKECGIQPYPESVIIDGVAMALGTKGETLGDRRSLGKSREIKAGVATGAGGVGIAGIQSGVIPEWFGESKDKLADMAEAEASAMNTDALDVMQTFQWVQMGLTVLLLAGVGYLLWMRFDRDRLDLG